MIAVSLLNTAAGEVPAIISNQIGTSQGTLGIVTDCDPSLNVTLSQRDSAPFPYRTKWELERDGNHKSIKVPGKRFNLIGCSCKFHAVVESGKELSR